MGRGAGLRRRPRRAGDGRGAAGAGPGGTPKAWTSPPASRCAGRARIALVTPSHQYPLGATLTASRRLQLLDWAQATGSWIIEDDYDSEYRYESQPITALQGTRPRRARRLHRDLQQGALPCAAGWLSGRSDGSGRSLLCRAEGDGHLPARLELRHAHGLHRGRTFRASPAADEPAVSRNAGRRSSSRSAKSSTPV